MLLELVRAGEAENFSEDVRVECALLFDAIGIYGDTETAKIQDMVMTYFKNLPGKVNVDMFLEVERIKKMAHNNKRNTVAAVAEAFRAMTDDDSAKMNAPKVGDKKPEGTVDLNALKFPKRL